MGLGEGELMESVDKINSLKSFQNLNVGKIVLTVLHHHLHLNLGKMQILPTFTSS